MSTLEFKWRYCSESTEYVTALERRALASETAIKVALSQAATGRPENMQYMVLLAMRRPGGKWVPASG